MQLASHDNMEGNCTDETFGKDEQTQNVAGEDEPTENLELMPVSGQEVPAAVMVIPPDGGWGWIVVAASFLCNFVVDGIIFSFGVFLTDLQTSLHASASEVALAGSLLSGFYLLAGPFVSALTNKYGFRVVSIAGAVLAACGFAASAYAKSITYLCVFFGVVGGIGMGLIYLPSVLVVGYYFERWRAVATGIAVCGSGIGTLVVAPVTARLIEAFGWRTAIWIQCVMILVAGLGCILYRPLKPVQVTLERNGDENHDVKENKRKNFPTAAEYLANSTSSLSQSIIMSRINALSGQTQSTPMIATMKNKRDRTISENSGQVPNRSRRGTLGECVIRSRRGTITKIDDISINRPLYRDDIFYSGSLHRLPHYASKRDFMGYTLSVTRLPTEKDFDEEEECNFCPEAVTRALAILFDPALLKSPSFIMLSVSGFLTLMGIFTPFIYLQDRALKSGMPKYEAIWLVSAIGVTNTIGRVVFGTLSNVPHVDALLINNIALTIGGVATMVSHLDTSASYQFSYAAIFGLALACFGCLRPIIIVDLYGIEKLTNAFGILLLFQGVAAVVGSPLAGYVMEVTHSYEYSFLLAGCFILISGAMLYPLKLIKKWEDRTSRNDSAFI